MLCLTEVSGSQDSDVDSQNGSDALSVGTDKSSQSGLAGTGTIVEGTNTVLVSAISASGKINQLIFLSIY